jgi:hypothetical protein
MAFHVGQRVVCVDDGPDYAGQSTKLVERHVYTVDDAFDWYGTPGVVIAGVQSWHPTGAYKASRFRPVQETDISIFTAMLSPTPKQKVRA